MRTESESCPPFTAGKRRERIQTDHQDSAVRSHRVNLSALSTAIHVLCLFSDHHCGLLDGDRGGRRRARFAPVEFEQLASYDDLLGLESYFSSSLHRLVPSSSDDFINRRWACDLMAPCTVVYCFFQRGAWVKISTRPDRPPRGFAWTTQQTLARMARLSLLRRLEFSFTFFGELPCRL